MKEITYSTFCSVSVAECWRSEVRGSFLENPLCENPSAPLDTGDFSSSISPRASKSRVSMKLRRSSGSANKT
ncbi:hypothetical protein PGIGA_G00021760 [Pangasianodon gigas]|uniref:Uncharacterized protein n=1 Tax=Pangasianodon gigas TaxID=30993 RepID=A0ACC5WVE1_PANGG|nr:hypothetical protein [Pangasianodon gigas]